jgi:hypothetical protein
LSLVTESRIAVPAPAVASRAQAEEQAQKAFSIAVMISAIRCTLSYIVFPFVAPILGVTSGVSSGVGIVASSVGIASNLFSIRRFHAAHHRWRWPITTINVSVIVLLTVLLVRDLTDVL